MKVNYRYIVLFLIVGAFLWSGQKAQAQDSDTLLVEWAKSDGTPNVNALRDVIAADTNDAGERLHKVYKLQQGGYYWITDGIHNADFKLQIVGEPGDPNDSAANPPIIQMVTRDDGSAPSGRMLFGESSVTLKNLYVVGADDQGVQTYYQPMQLDGSGNRYVFDNVIFERSNFAIPVVNSKGNTVIFKNSTFRNLIGKPSTQQWEGRGISIWASQDTIIVENNTFFNVGMTSFQLEGGYTKYFRFNHNTIVNQGRHFLISNKKNAFIANNLIINGFFHGEGYADLNSPGRVTKSTGMFPVGILPSSYGLEQERRIVLANTYSWRDPQFETFYADSIQPQYFTNDSTRYFFRTNDQIVAKDTVWLDSAPSGMTEDAFTGDIVDNMWANINDLRQGTTPATPYFYKLPEYATQVSWPLPENFAYTDSDLQSAGTDGLPIGDLNWFPEKKQDFLANQDQYVQEIEDLAGEPVSFDITNTLEGEDGALSGDASVSTVEGTTFYTMTNAGYIQWDFSLDAADSYTLEVVTRSESDPRGENLLLDGTGLRNRTGYGEYYFEDLTYPEWKTYTITPDTLIDDVAGALDLDAGDHTLKITPSWGYQDFQKVNVLNSNGDVVKELTAPNAMVEVVSPGVETAPGEPAENVPSGFRSVEIGAEGSSGTISFDLSDVADGSYLARIYYMAPDADVTGQLSVGGSVADDNISFTKSSAYTSATSVMFDVQDGQIVNGAQASSTLTLSADGHVKVDYLQLAKKATAIDGPGGKQIPDGYALNQNYPNPFNPSTNINFSLGQATNVQLTVYNILGRKVATLLNHRMSAGAHTIQFDASNLSSGVYIYRLQTDAFTATKQMMLIK